MAYHPPEIITTQASPAITADLAYESHGKCGETVVLWSNNEITSIFDGSVKEEMLIRWLSLEQEIKH